MPCEKTVRLVEQLGIPAYSVIDGIDQYDFVASFHDDCVALFCKSAIIVGQHDVVSSQIDRLAAYAVLSGIVHLIGIKLRVVPTPFAIFFSEGITPHIIAYILDDAAYLLILSAEHAVAPYLIQVQFLDEFVRFSVQ